MSRIEIKKIINNFGYLSLIQIFNLIFPLIIYPYLIRTVGKENYGIVVFAQSIAIYFSLFVNFGFNIYGTDAIAKCRGSIKRISGVVSAIFTTQVFFYLISVVLLYLVSLLYDDTSSLMLVLASYLCFHEIAVPVWYFQGIQQMRFIAVCNLVAKLTSLIIILFYVKESEDYLMILFAYAMGSILCGSLAFWKIFIKDRVQYRLPSLKILLATSKNSAPLFISHSLGGITAKSNAFLIGNFIGKTALSYYDLAEKLVNMVSLFFANFSNAIFPVMSTKGNPGFVRKAIRIVFITSIIVVILLMILSDYIVTIIGGDEMRNATHYLILMSVSIIFRAIGPIISTSVLVVNNLSHILSRSFIWVFASYFTGILLLYYLDELFVSSIIWVYLISLTIMISYRVYCSYLKGLRHWLV